MREKPGIPTCMLNSTLTAMYKANVVGFRCTHSFRYLNVFVHTDVPGFEGASFHYEIHHSI